MRAFVLKTFALSAQIGLVFYLSPTVCVSETSDAVDTSLADAPDKAHAIDRDEAWVLQRLYPFYFAYGHSEVKIQVSFKMPVVKTWPLYLGYTQQMFYVFGNHEKGFRDLTYNPELFYRLPLDRQGTVKSLDIGIFSHDSNGKPLPDHRSYNMSYVRLNLEGQSEKWLTRASVQLQALYSFQTTNMDIQNYIGPLAFNLSFIQLFAAWLDKSEVNLLGCPGGKFAEDWGRGGYQLSWSFRLGGIHLVPAFYIQYYYGYAETLLNYNRKVNDLRIGLIF